MTIPIEFCITGRPSSVNSTTNKKNIWKNTVNVAANAHLVATFAPQPVPAAHAGDVTAKIFFFPPTQQYLDVDNGLKHTIDGISPPILANDRTIIRLVAERFAPIPGASLIVPIGFAPVLSQALAIASGQASVAAGSPYDPQHAVAVKVESYVDNNGALW